MPTVETAGARIFYEERGGGGPLVLVPGLGAHSGIWGPFPRMFGEKMRVVTFDPRGLGRSSAGDGELSLELMAADVKEVLDAAGMERAALLGVSMGALVVLRLALDHPEAVSKLVLVTPGVLRSRYSDWLFDTLRLLKDRLSPEEYTQTMGMLAFAPPFFERGYGMIKERIRSDRPPARLPQRRRHLLRAFPHRGANADHSRGARRARVHRERPKACLEAASLAPPRDPRRRPQPLRRSDGGSG